MERILKSFRYLFALFSFIILTTTLSKTQVNLKLGAGIGAMIPISDFSGSTSDFYNGTHYGLGSGSTIYGKVKVGLSGWNIISEIDYSSLRRKGNSEPAQGAVELSQQILSIKVGPEFHLNIPALPVVPYVGVKFALNRFAGETTFQGVSKVPSGTYKVKGATRFGIGFSTGMEVSIGSYMSLDFNISYNLMNVFGKDWEDVNTGINQRIDSYLALNDDRDPQYAASDDKHFISEERNVHSILFTVGILFDF